MHQADPRTARSDHFIDTCCLSFRLSSLLKNKQNITDLHYRSYVDWPRESFTTPCLVMLNFKKRTYRSLVVVGAGKIPDQTSQKQTKVHLRTDAEIIGLMGGQESLNSAREIKFLVQTIQNNRVLRFIPSPSVHVDHGRETDHLNGGVPFLGPFDLKLKNEQSCQMKVFGPGCLSVQSSDVNL